ncbi:MAG: hypothetical protein ACK4I0_04720 [Brevundimonas sp.]|uniref:hypothetical protein n=1 Tax=Brevundimonas sp. TaxID=1871086 RepID=UPI00391D31F2
MSATAHDRVSDSESRTLSLDSFSYPDQQKASNPRLPAGEIELTGKMRTVMHGPYATLPPGRWTLTAQVIIDTRGTPLFLTFDWGAEPDFARMMKRIDRSGVYQVTLARDWLEPSRCEFRILASAAHFDGHLKVVDVTIMREDTTSDQPLAHLV